ncbi:probable kinase CHARK [Lolium rigidum]|uniref:probable kinase CHARK n=1 Tax=Lolium rigidum TaxID=89674 RepID=UPI001F5DFEC6|nr:probable kinase CHARK [Lolium rigidum]
MATSFILRTHRLLLLLIVSYTIILELRPPMMSWTGHRYLKNYGTSVDNYYYLLIPPFCNITRKGGGWVNEMFDSHEFRFHYLDMEWIFEPRNKTVVPLGVCEADKKMYYAYLMRVYLCATRLQWIAADVGHAAKAKEWIFLKPLSVTSFGGLFVISCLQKRVLFLFALFSCIAGLVSWWCSRRREEQTNEEVGRGAIPTPQFEEPAMPRRYHYDELAAATGNFSESQRIGQGGFGSVYCGFLNDGTGHIAIKVLSPESSAQGRKEFEAEVKIITRLSHRNVVRLLGWCDGENGGLLLVYELVSGGNLDKHLHSPDHHQLLTWHQRFEIALGLGCALRYLHTEVDKCVVHGDIKSSNVMIDSSGAAKLGDFGLARLLDHGAEPHTTETVAGTIGYIDPEFVNSRRPCTESDVYSFGIVLLEIASGRRPTPPPGQPCAASASATLLGRVREMYDRNAVLDAADSRLKGAFVEWEMERLLVTGLWCGHADSSQRPSMVQAMSFLQPEDAELRVPPPDAATHGGSRQLSVEMSHGSTRSSAASTYHTPPDTSYYLPTQE